MLRRSASREVLERLPAALAEPDGDRARRAAASPVPTTDAGDERG